MFQQFVYTHESEYAIPNILVLLPCRGTTFAVDICDCVLNGFFPFSFAKYLSYEPCFISTPLLPC